MTQAHEDKLTKAYEDMALKPTDNGDMEYKEDRPEVIELTSEELDELENDNEIDIDPDEAYDTGEDIEEVNF